MTTITIESEAYRCVYMAAFGTLADGESHLGHICVFYSANLDIILVHMYNKSSMIYAF